MHPDTRGSHLQLPHHAGLLASILIVGGFAVALAGVTSSLFDLDRHAVPKELALHSTALLVLFHVFADRRRIEIGLVGVLLIAYVAWSGLSSVSAENHWLALRALGITVSGVILFGAARRAAKDGGGPIIAAGLCAAAVLAAALGALQAYGLDWAWLSSGRPPSGTFGNRNFLAHLLAIATPVLAVLTLRARRGGWVPGLAGLAIITGAIVLTRSRAAWLGLAFGLAVTFLALVLSRGIMRGPAAPAVAAPDTRMRARAPRVAWLAAAIGGGALLAVLLPNRLDWRSDSPYSETLTGLANYREGSGRGRLIQFGNTLEMVRSAPVLGTGPGNWFVHYPRVTSPGDPAFAGNDPIPTNPWPSSDWVAFLAERGIVGVLLLAGAGIAAMITALRRLRPGTPPGETDRLAALSAAALSGMLAVAVVTGLFDAVLVLAAPTYFVFCLMGVLLPATRAVVSRNVSPKAGRALFAGASVLVLVLVVTSAGRLAAIRIAGDGRDRAAVERALRFDPGNHRLHLILARRGACRTRVPHARAAAALMPYHSAPAAALRACGAPRQQGP